MKKWLFSQIWNSVADRIPSTKWMQLTDRFDCIYAIGDVHGCMDQLASLERKIFEDGLTLPGQKLIIMLGDYIDRGPSSAAVLDYIMRVPPKSFRRICLSGNHEDMFLRYLARPSLNDAWLDLGGRETLASYGIYLDNLPSRQVDKIVRSLIPPTHVAFLNDMPFMVSTRDTCFVHAGIDPQMALHEQTKNAVLHSRPTDFNWSIYNGGRLVVHGHTPIDLIEVETDRINIDLNAHIKGTLAALRLIGSHRSIILSN